MGLNAHRFDVASLDAVYASPDIFFEANRFPANRAFHATEGSLHLRQKTGERAGILFPQRIIG